MSKDKSETTKSTSDKETDAASTGPGLPSRGAQVSLAIIGGIVFGPSGAAAGWQLPVLFTSYFQARKEPGSWKKLALCAGVAAAGVLLGGSWLNPASLLTGAVCAVAVTGLTRYTTGSWGIGWVVDKVKGLFGKKKAVEPQKTTEHARVRVSGATLPAPDNTPKTKSHDTHHQTASPN